MTYWFLVKLSAATAALLGTYNRKHWYSRHDKLTRNTVYTVQTNVISPSETASAVTQLSRSGTGCPIRGSRCGCSSISHAVAMQFRQQATQTSVGQRLMCPEGRVSSLNKSNPTSVGQPPWDSISSHAVVTQWYPLSTAWIPVWLQQHQSRSHHTVQTINNTQQETAWQPRCGSSISHTVVTHCRQLTIHN